MLDGSKGSRGPVCDETILAIDQSNVCTARSIAPEIVLLGLQSWHERLALRAVLGSGTQRASIRGTRFRRCLHPRQHQVRLGAGALASGEFRRAAVDQSRVERGPARASVPLVEEILAVFTRRDLITEVGPGTFQYQPRSSDTVTQVAESARLYAKRPLAIVEEIVAARQDGRGGAARRAANGRRSFRAASSGTKRLMHHARPRRRCLAPRTARLTGGGAWRFRRSS